ncbi:MAG: AraC family transcriptional regulator [Candidatus Thiodiazotropha sp.]
MLDPAEHHTLASVGVLLTYTLKSYGLDIHPLIRTAGIDPARFDNPDQRIPMAKLQKLWALGTEASGDPCFGLRYAEYIQPASLHGMGLAWAASDTLLDGVKRLIRYQSVLSTVLAIRIEEEPRGYRLVFETRDRIAPAAASTDATLGAFLRMCRITTGPGVTPLSVSLRHAEPPCSQHMREWFAAPVTFRASRDSLLFARASLESPIPSAHPELARANDSLVQEYLDRLDQHNLSQQVRIRIIEDLPNGLPRQTRIAQQLNLSLRNLQRKLQSEGTNFKQLVDETRKALAIEYLTVSGKPLIEIGYLLGFTESSNFSRAFRRWTGESPQSYRQRHH